MQRFWSSVNVRYIVIRTLRRGRPAALEKRISFRHLELADAMQLARHCQPQKLMLSHLYHEWDGIDLAAEAKKLWPGETIEAFDGLRLEF